MDTSGGVVMVGKREGKEMLNVARLMKYRGVNTQALSESQSLAYNTALGYRRASVDRMSLDVLGRLAEGLRVKVWELFYHGEMARPLVKIAEAVGVTYQGHGGASLPVTSDEYEALLMAIAEKVGADVTADDFGELDSDGGFGMGADADEDEEEEF